MSFRSIIFVYLFLQARKESPQQKAAAFFNSKNRPSVVVDAAGDAILNNDASKNAVVALTKVVTLLELISKTLLAQLEARDSPTQSSPKVSKRGFMAENKATIRGLTVTHGFYYDHWPSHVWKRMKLCNLLEKDALEGLKKHLSQVCLFNFNW